MMTVKLLTEHHLKFLSLKGGYTGSSESTLVKMPHCWKSHVTAQIIPEDHRVLKFLPKMGMGTNLVMPWSIGHVVSEKTCWR